MTKLFDPFTLAILATVVLALVFPVSGYPARVVGVGGDVAIALLFFLQGVRLSRQAVMAGLEIWRLHLTVLTATFIAFPLVVLVLAPLSGTLIAPPIYAGLLFLAALPSTVQSSVVLTALARGDVAAALCSATLSNLLGMVLTPLLVALLLGAHGDVSFHGLGAIALYLLLPFVLGQLAQHWVAPWLNRYRPLVGLVDRGSVLLVVYGAIAAATVAGQWSTVPPASLAIVVLIDAALVAVALVGTSFAARWLGFSRGEEIAIVFCGSKKSLTIGISMANALFAGPALGPIVLPLIVFHQLQLTACALLARRYAERA